jgi:hypothetical protein
LFDFSGEGVALGASRARNKIAGCCRAQSEIGTIFARRRDAEGATSEARNGLVSPRRRQGK